MTSVSKISTMEGKRIKTFTVDEMVNTKTGRVYPRAENVSEVFITLDSGRIIAIFATGEAEGLRCVIGSMDTETALGVIRMEVFDAFVVEVRNRQYS